MKTSIIGSLQAFVLDRPPVVAFTLSLAAITMTIFLVAFYFKDKDLIVDSHAQEDWASFNNYLSDQKFCIDDTRSNHSSLQAPADIHLSLTPRFINTTLLLGNVTGLAINQTQLIESDKGALALTGALSLNGWKRSCHHQNDQLFEESAKLNITVIIPNMALRSSDVSLSCVYVSGPSYIYWPASMKTKHDTSSGLSQSHQCNEVAVGVLKVVPFRPLQEHGGCERGNAVQITYDLSDYKSKTYLSRDDKIQIFSHLLLIGYLLLSLIFIIFLWAIFIGRNLVLIRRHTLLPTKETLS